MISFYVVAEMENLVQYVNHGVKSKIWKVMLKECEVICQNTDSKSKYNIHESQFKYDASRGNESKK